MHPCLSFSLLLASFFPFISTYVESRPTIHGMVTLPLIRLEQYAELHPAIRMHYHVNRRLARIAHRQEASSDSFERRHSVRTLYNGYPAPNLNAYNSNNLTPSNTQSHNESGAYSFGLGIVGSDASYVAMVQMGSPPRNFRLMVDSGTPYFWIGGDNCKSPDGSSCGNHAFIGRQSSSSYQETGAHFSYAYGRNGLVSGNIATDKLIIDGLPLDNYEFGAALNESWNFANSKTPYDGSMGLSRPQNNDLPNPVQLLAKNGKIASATVSYKLSRYSDGTNDGEITFGGLDSTKFDPSTLVTFNNTSTAGVWEVPLSGAAVNGKDLGFQGRFAVMDTAAIGIIAPPNDAAAFYAQIPGSKSTQDNPNIFTIPCTTTAVVSLNFGGTFFDIKTSDMLYAPVDPNNLTGNCISVLSAGQILGPNEWYVGAAFLKNIYFTTHFDTNQISLAKLV